MTGAVLCVDEPSLLERTVDRLERHLADATIEAASSAEAGLAACADRSPDCIVSGDELPDESGLGFLRRVREDRPDVPFVLFAGHGSEAVASEAISAGVTEYVRRDGSDRYRRLADRVADATDRHRTRTAYRDLFDAATDAILVYDPETGEIVDLDRNACGRLEHFDACDRTVDDLRVAASAPPEFPDGEDDGSLHRDEWLCEADGERFRADVYLKRLPLEGRDRVAALVRDVTDAKRRERELEAFREAVERAGHSIYITDADAEIRYVNAAFEDVTGYSAEEAVGRTPRLLKSGEHDAPFYRELWGTIRDGDVWRSEIVNERKDGSRYVADQTIAPITDGSGEIVRFVAVNADVSDRKRHERQLEGLYEATTEWLEADSREAVCELVSDRLADLPGFDAHGLWLYDESTQRLEPVAASGDATASLEDGIAWTAFETGEPDRYDGVHTGPDVYGPEIDVRGELAVPLGDHGALLVGLPDPDAVTDADESVAKVLGSALTEVLDRIEREQTLETQNDRLERFASVVSHDLRNPLSIASGHLDLALETGDEDYLEEVERAHDRMERIIDDLLWLAREGREIGEPRPVDLADVVDRAWAHVDTDGATLVAECDRTIAADPDRLQQLFENLFRNSVEHGSTGSRPGADDSAEHGGSDVTVRVGLLEDGFYVEDDGPGIPADDRERVLEAGYSTDDDGTGYGLWIVRTVVDAHEWDLAVTEGSAGGARFEVHDVP
jgi:PAS domain S-box-containing protein